MASTNDSVGSASVFSGVVVPPSTCFSLEVVSCPLESVLGLGGLGVIGDFKVSGELLVDDGDTSLLSGASHTNQCMFIALSEVREIVSAVNHKTSTLQILCMLG